MVESAGCGELQQLVQEEECEEQLSHGGEATPPSTPARSQRPSKTEPHNSNVSQQVLWESNTQVSPIISKGSSGQGTSQGSMVSGRIANTSSYTGNPSRLTYLNEKEKQRPIRPDPPRITRQHKEVPDVRHMEQALLQLLEDFHSGNLRAFGKDCSMEQMTEIREQQERLARLHFELGQRQEVGGEQSGLRQSSANMRHLLHRLQQLSVCIEKLHRILKGLLTYAKMKPAALSQPQRMVVAHDTLQRLSLAKRPAFNALWEPKDMVNIDVKAIDKRRILGDANLESIIKERPRRYMTPSVSLDDIQDKDERNLLIDFTYKTIAKQAAKEVWGEFKIRSSCLKRHMEKQEKPLIHERAISRLPVRFQNTAREWDHRQIRSFRDCHNKEKTQKDRMQKFDLPEIHADEKMLEKERTIKKLICEDKLNISYDKLPLSYTGYRSHVAYGVPLEKREFVTIA